MDIDEKTGLILFTLATPVKNVVVVDCNKLLELLYKNCQVIHNKSIDSPQVDRKVEIEKVSKDIYEDIGISTLAIPIKYPIILEGLGLQEYLANNSEHREIRIKVIKNRADKINKQINK